MSDTTGKQDLQWFSSLSDSEISAFFSVRGDVELELFPAKSVLSIDNRSYSSSLSMIRGLQSSPCYHLLTLNTASPGCPLGIFFRVNSGHKIPVVYDDIQVSLKLGSAVSVQEVKQTQRGNNLGTRGVAALSTFAEHDWNALTGHITEASLKSAGIREGHVVLGVELPGGDEQQPCFAPLPRLQPMHGMTASQVTAYHLDRSTYMMALIETRYEGKFELLLGEFELAFICFALLGNVAGLEHWAKLLRELCNCSTIESDIGDFFSTVATLLVAQFKLIDTEVVEMLPRMELRRCLACLMSNGRDEAAMTNLSKCIEQQFGWNLTGSDDEGDDSDGPVIVSMEANG